MEFHWSLLSLLDLPPLPPAVPTNLSEPLIARRRRPHMNVGRARLTFLALRRHVGPLASGGVFVALGVLFAVVPWIVAANDMRIERDGVTATATIMRNEITQDADGSTEHRIHYAFTLPDGTSAEGQEVIIQDGFESLGVGDRLRVVFDPARPEDSYPLGTGMGGNGGLGSTGAATVLSIIGVLLVGFGGRSLWVPAVRLPSRWHRLLQDGYEVEGHVVQVEVDDEDADRARLQYAYVDRSGTSHQSVTAWVPVALTADWKYGDPGIVRYSRSDRDESIWLGRGRLTFFR